MTKLGVVAFSGLVSHPGVASCEGDWDKLQKLRWVYLVQDRKTLL